jgi:hypothetical protein
MITIGLNRHFSEVLTLIIAEINQESEREWEKQRKRSIECGGHLANKCFVAHLDDHLCLFLSIFP